MRRLAVALAVSAAFTASPALAQAGPTSVGQAIANTLYQACHRTQDGADLATCIALPAAVSAAPVLAAAAAWFSVIDGLGIPLPLNLGAGTRSNDGRWDCTPPECVGFYGEGGSTGGGGTIGSWDCEDFDYRLDGSGNLIIPSIPLKPGGPVEPGATLANKINYVVGAGLANNVYGGDSHEAAALIRIHYENSGRGTDARNWYGSWKIVRNSTSRSYHFANQAYFNASGSLVARVVAARTIGDGDSYYTGNTPPDEPCPESGSEGGDFHFYPYRINAGSWTECVAYAPNFSISPSGYAYPPTTSVARADIGAWLSAASDGGWYGSCPLDAELIRKLADKLWQEAAAQGGYTGKPYEPVTTEDVRTGGDDPKVKDMVDDPAVPDANETPEEPTVEDPDEPDPSDTGTPAYDPTVSNPDLVPEDIDWWPDLPSITVDLGNPACPTFPLDLTGYGGAAWSYTIDKHCPIIEDNRAAIGVIVLLLFGITSVLIVLRA